MAVKVRNTKNEAELEELAMKKASDDSLSDKKENETRSLEERVKSRADGRYFAGISYRITDKQKALIAFAVDEVHMSRQEMIEHVLMPWLEEQVGEKFDELHPEWR